MKYWLPALIVLLSLQTGDADQRIEKWDAFSSGEGSGAVDCRNCAEDEYIWLFCPMFSRQIDVSINGIVLKETLKERTPIFITFDVDGEKSSHPGTVSFSEMFGNIPKMALAKDDPVLERLRKGRRLTVSTSGASIDIGLAGSNAALEELIVGCE